MGIGGIPETPPDHGNGDYARHGVWPREDPVPATRVVMGSLRWAAVLKGDDAFEGVSITETRRRRQGARFPSFGWARASTCLDLKLGYFIQPDPHTIVIPGR